MDNCIKEDEKEYEDDNDGDVMGLLEQELAEIKDDNRKSKKHKHSRRSHHGKKKHK